MKRELSYLKEKFETNDIPKEEDFSDWMDSYWHKDEKIPMDNLNIDVSSKADKTAENLSAENITSWKTKLNEPSQITIDTTSSIDTNKDVGGVRMHGKNVVINNGANNIDLQCLTSSEPNFNCSIVKIGSGSITIKAGTGATLVQTDYTAVMNGGAGSAATIVRVGNTFYLRIYNA